MAVYWQEFRQHCVEKLTEQRDFLAALESGRLQCRQRTAENPFWADATASMIEQTRRNIAEYEGLIIRIDKDHPQG